VFDYILVLCQQHNTKNQELIKSTISLRNCLLWLRLCLPICLYRSMVRSIFSTRPDTFSGLLSAGSQNVSVFIWIAYPAD